MKTKTNEYEKVIDALNRIDETAENNGGETYEEQEQRAKDYDLVATFIDKHAKRS